MNPGRAEKGRLAMTAVKSFCYTRAPCPGPGTGASLISSPDGENIQNLNMEKKGDAI